MINEYQYVKLYEILSRILKHPLLLDVNMESAALYTIDFMHTVGCPEMFLTKEAEVTIDNYRGKLPCDVVSITLVKDANSGRCLIAMTDNFLPNERNHTHNLSFKTLNRVIYTSFKDGKIIISYIAIPVDEDGFPLIADDPVYLKALELYIKREVFAILFDLGKINERVLTKTELDYFHRVGLLQSRIFMPSESQMEAIKNNWCSLLQSTDEFKSGFKGLGMQSLLKTH